MEEIRDAATEELVAVVDKGKIIRVVSIPEEPHSWAWLGWFLVALGGFGVLEGYAVRRRKDHLTLSCHTRRLLGIYPRRKWAPLGESALIGGLTYFTLWFIKHIVFDVENEES